MFKKFENIWLYHGRMLKKPLTFGDKIFIIWEWFSRPFRKYKIVNVFANKVIPYSRLSFVLSDKEKEDAEKVRKEHGAIEYVIYPLGGIGWGLKVRVIQSGKEFDITDLDAI